MLSKDGLNLMCDRFYNNKSKVKSSRLMSNDEYRMSMKGLKNFTAVGAMSMQPTSNFRKLKPKNKKGPDDHFEDSWVTHETDAYRSELIDQFDSDEGKVGDFFAFPFEY